MAFSASQSSLSATPNVTPLIDVLLVLLIIFMVMLPASPRGLDSLIPDSAPDRSQRTPTPPLILQVAPSRTQAQGVAYRLSGTEISPAVLRAALQDRRSGLVDPVLFIDGDPRLDFRAVAQAVSDAKHAGFARIGLLPRAAH